MVNNNNNNNIHTMSGMSGMSSMEAMTPSYIPQQDQMIGPRFSDVSIMGPCQGIFNWNNVASQPALQGMNPMTHFEKFGGIGGDVFVENRVDHDKAEEEMNMSAKTTMLLANNGVEDRIISSVPQDLSHLNLNMDESTAPPPVLACRIGTSTINDDDVLSGRGGGTNVHTGEVSFCCCYCCCYGCCYCRSF